MARKEMKCGTCGEIITINRQNIDKFLFYSSKYHHVECFTKMVEGKLSEGKRMDHWQKVLDEINTFKQNAISKAKPWVVRDELNDYLINTYGVTSVSSQFWTAVSDLSNGSYRQKKCKPVSTEMLLDTWKWGQHHLDKIAAKNKTNNRGPSNGEQRIRYDFAIVIRHIDDYKKHIAETKEQAEIVTKHTENKNRINYEQLYAQSNHQNISESIIDLMNEIF